MQLTAVLSGPLAGRAPLLHKLDRLGANVDEQPEANVSHGLEIDAATGWITVLAEDLTVVEKALAKAGRWVLRLHWPTPPCPFCNGHGLVSGPGAGTQCAPCKGSGKSNHRLPTPVDFRTELAELRARVAELEGSKN
jgi:hypothetical protein